MRKEIDITTILEKPPALNVLGDWTSDIGHAVLDILNWRPLEIEVLGGTEGFRSVPEGSTSSLIKKW